jgi:hypothetical protein
LPLIAADTPARLLALIAQVLPIIEIKTVDTDPPAIVGLAPHTLVAAPPVAAKDSVKISKHPVSVQLLDKFGNDFGHRKKSDFIADPFSLRERRISREVGV